MDFGSTPVTNIFYKLSIYHFYVEQRNFVVQFPRLMEQYLEAQVRGARNAINEIMVIFCY